MVIMLWYAYVPDELNHWIWMKNYAFYGANETMVDSTRLTRHCARVVQVLNPTTIWDWMDIGVTIAMGHVWIIRCMYGWRGMMGLNRLVYDDDFDVKWNENDMTNIGFYGYDNMDKSLWYTYISDKWNHRIYGYNVVICILRIAQE